MKKKFYILSICAISLATSPMYADFWDDIAKGFEALGKEIAKGWKDVETAFKDFGDMAGAGFNILPDTVQLGQDIADTVNNIKALVAKIKTEKDVSQKIISVGSIIQTLIPDIKQLTVIIKDANEAYIKPYHANQGKDIDNAIAGIQKGANALNDFMSETLPGIAQTVQEIIQTINEIEAATKQVEESS